MHTERNITVNGLRSTLGRTEALIALRLGLTCVYRERGYRIFRDDNGDTISIGVYPTQEAQTMIHAYILRKGSHRWALQLFADSDAMWDALEGQCVAVVAYDASGELEDLFELGNGAVNIHTVPMRPEYGFRAEGF